MTSTQLVPNSFECIGNYNEWSNYFDPEKVLQSFMSVPFLKPIVEVWYSGTYDAERWPTFGACSTRYIDERIAKINLVYEQIVHEDPETFILENATEFMVRDKIFHGNSCHMRNIALCAFEWETKKFHLKVGIVKDMNGTKLYNVVCKFQRELDFDIVFEMVRVHYTKNEFAVLHFPGQVHYVQDDKDMDLVKEWILYSVDESDKFISFVESILVGLLFVQMKEFFKRCNEKKKMIVLKSPVSCCLTNICKLHMEEQDILEEIKAYLVNLRK